MFENIILFAILFVFILMCIMVPMSVLFIFIIFIAAYCCDLILKKIFPNKKDEVLKNILFVIIFVFVLFTWLEDCGGMICNNIPKLSYKIANYNYSIKALSFINNIHLGNTKISYILRKNLFKQYKNIKNGFNDKDYEAIGTFNNINEDYIKIESKYSDKINQEYKQLYLNELKNNLDNYIDRNKNLGILRFSKYERTAVKGSGVARFLLNIHPKAYSVPNRIIFYPQLALSYLYQADIKQSKETINELTKILYNFEVVLNQEKNNNSEDYKNNKMDFYRVFHDNKNKNIMNYSYPVFINKYPETILQMQWEIDKDNICSNTYIFDFYLESLKYGSLENPEIMRIIKDECKYNKE